MLHTHVTGDRDGSELILNCYIHSHFNLAIWGFEKQQETVQIKIFKQPRFIHKNIIRAIREPFKSTEI